MNRAIWFDEQMSTACCSVVQWTCTYCSRYICNKTHSQEENNTDCNRLSKVQRIFGLKLLQLFRNNNNNHHNEEKICSKLFLKYKNEAYSLKSTNSVRRAISNSFVSTGNSIFSASASEFALKLLSTPSTLSIFVDDIININSQTFSVIWIYPIVVNLVPAATATVEQA